MPQQSPPWPHAPKHQLNANGNYFVTASAYKSEHHFRGASRLGVLQRGLITVARDYDWRLEAWAVFSNHYHFIGSPPAEAANATTLPEMLKVLHVKTAEWVNRLDKTEGRQVWFNYWDTRLTFQRSYLARLNYVHQNAVKHGLVALANQYPWCSAAWLEQNAAPAIVQSIYKFKTDSVRVFDPFEPSADW